MAIIEADAAPQTPFERDVADTQKYFDSPRFDGIIRLYTARQVVEQRGAIPTDYTVARDAAAAFHPRLRELYAQKKSITTFGPYSPGQAVVMKRVGIEGIYLGGWASSAKGSISEDPGPDLASYPLSQVPEEAAGLVRALLTADRNQQYLRLQMTDEQRASTPATDFRPFIIADADTGHGGDPHVLDVMKVPGIIVARTDAEAANLVESRADERDQPFLLGVTNLKIPSYKSTYLAMMRRFYQAGVTELNGHLLYAVPDGEYATADAWLERNGIAAAVTEAASAYQDSADQSIDAIFDDVESQFVDAWQADAGLMTYGE